MTENEEVKVEDVVTEETEEVLEAATDATDWEARAKKLESQAIAQRAKTKELRAQLSKFQEAVLPDKKVEKKQGFDYAEKAYLKTSGLAPDEFPFVAEVMQATGKSLDEVLETKYFQAELKERREARATKEAIPSGSRRSASSTRDTVDYWLAKGELPPASERKLRSEVVNARIKLEKDSNMFTDNSIV